jgi:hypothetical protein
MPKRKQYPLSKGRSSSPPLFADRGLDAVNNPTKDRPAAVEDPDSTRQLSKFKTFFLQNIKSVSDREQLGVIRQIQRIVAKGVTHEQIAIALRNYADDPFRKESDERFTKNIMSFFTETCIKEWQTPLPVSRTRERRQSPELDRLDALEALNPEPVPFPPKPVPRVVDDEEERFVL